MGVASSRSCDLDRLRPDAGRLVFSDSYQVIFQCTLSQSREYPFRGFRPGSDTIGTVQPQKIHGTLKFHLAAQLICVFIPLCAKAGLLMTCLIIRVEPSYDWLFVASTGVYLLDFFCSGIQFFFTGESLSLLYLLVIS